MDAGLTNNSPQAQAATPAQQTQFDMLLGRARQLIGETAEEWLRTLQQSPVDGAVTLGTQTLHSLANMSEQAGEPVDPAVLLHVGIQLVKDVAAIANQAGIVPDEQLEPFLQEVMQLSIAEYMRMDAEDGLLSPEDAERAQGVLAGQPSAGGAPQPEGMLARMAQGGV